MRRLQDFLRYILLPLLFGPVLLAIASVLEPTLATVGAQEFEPYMEPPPYTTPQWRARGDYVFTWIQGNAVPSLVTTSPNGTLRPTAGELGQPGTSTLVGNNRFDEQARPGGRFELDHSLTPDTSTGITASFLYVTDNSPGVSLASTGDPILARPYFNVATNQPDVELIAFPNVVDGQINIATSSNLVTSDVCLRQLFQSSTRHRIDFLYGYRYLRFAESLSIREDLQSTDPAGLFPIGTHFVVVDQFRTTNQFHGAAIGITAEWYEDFITFDTYAKISLGGVTKHGTIGGVTTVTVPGFAPATSAGGLLALPTNIGARSETDVAALPEFGVNTSIRLTEAWSFRCGYSVLVLSNVFRTGKQIDPNVNPTQLGGGALAGTAAPTPTRLDSGLWVQGLNLGITFDW